MRYHAKVEREGGTFAVVFADAPGCMTQANTKERALGRAREALDEWLRAHLENGMVPPRPKRALKGTEAIGVDPSLAVAVQLRWARQAAGFSQAQAAKAAGVSQQQIARLENPDENPTLATIKRVATALGANVEFLIEAR